jgi:phage/plasmid-like protein (TIGR03299 family)
MADEIANVNGKDSMAFVGEKPWHLKGQELTKDASIETWIEEAGMNFEIKSTDVQYQLNGTQTYAGKKVLYRDDVGTPLAVLSDKYKIVQPKEIMEFFRDLTQSAGMYLETAGVLFDGRRYWAMANTGRAGEVLGNDKVKGNLLLSTACDGSLATTAMFTAVRVVCNNTLRLSLDSAKSAIKVNHGRTFDAADVKLQLGLIDIAWDNFMKNINVLSTKSVSDEAARKFFFNLTKNPEVLDSEQSFVVERTVNDLMNRFKNGIGHDFHANTAWGLVNAVTERVGYAGKGSLDAKFTENFYGNKAKIADTAYASAVEMYV